MEPTPHEIFLLAIMGRPLVAYADQGKVTFSIPGRFFPPDMDVPKAQAIIKDYLAGDAGRIPFAFDHDKDMKNLQAIREAFWLLELARQTAADGRELWRIAAKHLGVAPASLDRFANARYRPA